MEFVDMPQAIAVVDPFSTGAHLALEVIRRGYKCVRVLSAFDSPIANLVQAGFENVQYAATIQHDDRTLDQNDAVEETIKQLQDLSVKVVAVLPGAETGVELADQLSAGMGLRTNGTAQSLARRNKYVMGETVRNAGVRAVKQANCTSEQDLLSFLDSLRVAGSDELRCVVKPVQSAGTDDVFLCQNEQEARAAFAKIFGKVNGIGLLNDCVLAQEFLVGKEYVVDKVSRDGVHKLVAIWEYDKRKVNGANFVYFGMRLIRPDDVRVSVLCSYADQVLDAVGVVNGPSHMEVMLKTVHSPTGDIFDPCLVEVGARCHGGEGTWLSTTAESIGYNQVTMTVDAYLDGAQFAEIDAVCYPQRKAVREVDFVSYHSGVLRGMPGEPLLRALSSFRGLSWEVQVGGFCHKTIDCFTRPGCAQLVADTEEQADADFELLHQYEREDKILAYAIECPDATTEGVLVLVGAAGEGVTLAETLIKLNFKLILVRTTGCDISDELCKSAHQVVDHNGVAVDTAAIIRESEHILAISAGDDKLKALVEELKGLLIVDKVEGDELCRLDKNMP